MSKQLIGGILQVGIGVTDMPHARSWYHNNLHFSAQVLEERSVTDLMTAYTGGVGHERQAAVIMNMAGAGGIEVWQYLSRTPVHPVNPPRLGDFGIFAVKVKTPDLGLANKLLGARVHPTPISKELKGRNSFFFQDPFGNVFQVVKEEEGYFSSPKLTSGIFGCIVGCSDLERSIDFYTNVLGFELKEKREAEVVENYRGLNGESSSYRRALLTKPKSEIGGFSKFLGATEIELVQAVDYQGVPMYENRYWGDPGFMHVCFDVSDMDAIKSHCAAAGHAFVLDSFETEKGKSFNMGNVTSRVAYINDTDGTAIEFVETHKVPLIPALGIAINLKGKKTKKNVPDWVLKLVALNRVKG
jgi:catechol 2,3-dioxygenase-like lactoylglutathione lyase family enzyme